MKTHQRCIQREPYVFKGRGGDKLYWERRVPGDSRVEQISCSAEWFYSQMTKGNA